MATPGSSTPAASTSGAASAPKKRKLACAACRARRIRCEWPESGGSGCVACALAELRCPGEPEPRKRQKRNDGTAGAQAGGGAAGTVDVSMQSLELGGALTFHLIESLFLMANPSIPGMPYHLFRDLLNSAGGSSRELEIAAECLCSAFIASAATFSDHSSLIGPGNVEMPVEIFSRSAPLPALDAFSPLVPFGPKRRASVLALSQRAIDLCAESPLREPQAGVEGVYTMLAMDQMMTLSAEGGRREREYVEEACDMYKEVVVRKPKEVAESLGWRLLALDAQSATVLKQPLGFSDEDLAEFFPTLDTNPQPSVVFDPSSLVAHEEGWTNLGAQLAPLNLCLTMLYRRLHSHSDQPSVPMLDIIALWQGVDSVLRQLDQADAVISTLPPLDTQDVTDHRHFDLTSLTNSCRRSAIQLDLLLHERILETVLAAGAAPDEQLLSLYAQSLPRVHRDFGVVTTILGANIRNRSLLCVRRMFEMLEVCTSWITLRGVDAATGAVLINELGITVDSAQILLPALDLASWSSPLMAQQKTGLQAAIQSAMGNVAALEPAAAPAPAQVPVPAPVPHRASTAVSPLPPSIPPYQQVPQYSPGQQQPQGMLGYGQQPTYGTMGSYPPLGSQSFLPSSYPLPQQMSDGGPSAQSNAFFDPASPWAYTPQQQQQQQPNPLPQYPTPATLSSSMLDDQTIAALLGSAGPSNAGGASATPAVAAAAAAGVPFDLSATDFSSEQWTAMVLASQAAQASQRPQDQQQQWWNPQ